MGNFWDYWLAGWIWISIAIAVGFLVYIGVKWTTWGWGDRLTAIFAIWIVPHVWEEWVWPGGFHYMYNTLSGSATPDRYPMSELTDMITNFGLLVVSVVVVAIWGARVPVMIAAMLFSGFEAVIHTASVYMSYGHFGTGRHVLAYDPGLATALLGYLPLCLGLILVLRRTTPRPTLRQWLIGAGMTLILLVIVFIPEQILKDPNSPYRFQDHGYYNQFITSE